MEVDKAKYPQQLLTILKQIANAKFVTFDLEMSGIMAGQYKFGKTKPLRSANKPSLQEQYLETKEAADMYQVLQVGITIVEEDHERGMYVARPYNFNLSPLFLHGDRLDVDRKFTFSSSACDFLVKNGFNFGAVFEKGVPYLSREEEVQSRARIAKRLGPQEREDIIIAPNEHETLEFFRKARKTIKDWINDKSKSRQDFVNIGSSEGPLNGYQRRLIHQLVTNEFPEYRTFARNEKSFMQIEKIDHQKEAEFQRKKLVDFDGMIAKQTGLRWIFEALCGGDLSGIDPWWFCYGPDSKSKNDMKNEMEGELRKVAMALKVKKTVLVGHNMFTDLMFLYKTFVGPLPRHSRDFQKCIHALFPVVIDTKYLATYKADDMNPREGLKQLWEPYKNVHMPFVVLEEQHMAYGASYGKDHEAGFDSWMTADLFIKISAKLYSEGRTTAPPPESYLALQPAPAFESSTSGGEDLTTDDAASDVSSDWSEEWFEEDHLPGSLPGGGVALPKNPPDTNGKASMIDSLPPMWHAMQLNPASGSELNGTSSNGHGAGTGVIQQWLPAIENKFWDAFVNILRVNSIEGGVCRLSLICEDDF